MFTVCVFFRRLKLDDPFGTLNKLLNADQILHIPVTGLFHCVSEIQICLVTLLQLRFLAKHADESGMHVAGFSCHITQGLHCEHGNFDHLLIIYVFI